jgi:hypothetical protein
MIRQKIHYYGNPDSKMPACKVDARVANDDRSTRNEDIEKTTCLSCLRTKAFGNPYGRHPGALRRYQELVDPTIIYV